MISIITNKKVDKTFGKEDCLLKRTIIKIIKENNIKKFIILTERCNYYTTQHSVFDENTGEQILDKQGNPIIKYVTELKSLSKKDKESVFVMSYEQVNNFYENIKSQVPNNLTKMQTENLEEQIALLVMTQQEEPWNTQASDWELLN